MKTLHKFFLISLAVIAFSSCKKFLDVKSPNDVSDQDLFTDANSLLSARIGLYNSMQDDHYYGGYFPLMIDAYSDNGAAGGYSDPDLNQFNDKTLTADNGLVASLWVAIYNTIYTSNQIIVGVDEITDPALSDEVRNDVKGEALCIRALAHFDLLRTFGEHWDVNSAIGIPLVLKVANPEDIFPRNTVQECYDAILNDLLQAQSLVSGDDVEGGTGAKTAGFITPSFVNALLARVYLYEKDYADAITMADDVINSGQFSIEPDVQIIYTTKLSTESIFELQFNVQDRSQYNNLTYVRDDALRVDVAFVVNSSLNDFFSTRPDDVRASLMDFDPNDNDPSIQPDGRSQKYRGEETQDNSAYIMRISEVYLIAAEAKGLAGGGLDDLNLLRANRGLSDLTPVDVPDEDAFQIAVQDERRAELNFEGHRYFDLARIGKVQEVIGADVLPVFPIPSNEIAATGGAITQYPGY